MNNTDDIANLIFDGFDKNEKNDSPTGTIIINDDAIIYETDAALNIVNIPINKDISMKELIISLDKKVIERGYSNLMIRRSGFSSFYGVQWLGVTYNNTEFLLRLGASGNRNEWMYFFTEKALYDREPELDDYQDKEIEELSAYIKNREQTLNIALASQSNQQHKSK